MDEVHRLAAGEVLEIEAQLEGGVVTGDGAFEGEPGQVRGVRGGGAEEDEEERDEGRA